MKRKHAANFYIKILEFLIYSKQIYEAENTTKEPKMEFFIKLNLLNFFVHLFAAFC